MFHPMDILRNSYVIRKIGNAFFYKKVFGISSVYHLHAAWNYGVIVTFLGVSVADSSASFESSTRSMVTTGFSIFR